jgi:DNA polymerase III epsilon subunit-like protein
MNTNTTYVSIDIETTGLNPENCHILEIGAFAARANCP